MKAGGEKGLDAASVPDPECPAFLEHFPSEELKALHRPEEFTLLSALGQQETKENMFHDSQVLLPSSPPAFTPLSQTSLSLAAFMLLFGPPTSPLTQAVVKACLFSITAPPHHHSTLLLALVISPLHSCGCRLAGLASSPLSLPQPSQSITAKLPCCSGHVSHFFTSLYWPPCISCSKVRYLLPFKTLPNSTVAPI